MQKQENFGSSILLLYATFYCLCHCGFLSFDPFVVFCFKVLAFIIILVLVSSFSVFYSRVLHIVCSKQKLKVQMLYKLMLQWGWKCNDGKDEMGNLLECSNAVIQWLCNFNLCFNWYWSFDVFAWSFNI